jgi:hypothetical protein
MERLIPVINQMNQTKQNNNIQELKLTGISQQPAKPPKN